MSPGVTLSRATGSARFSAVRWGAFALDIRTGAALPMGAPLGAATLLFTLSAVPKRRGAALGAALPAAMVLWLRISTSAFSLCIASCRALAHSLACVPARAHTRDQMRPHGAPRQPRAARQRPQPARAPVLLRFRLRRLPCCCSCCCLPCGACLQQHARRRRARCKVGEEARTREVGREESMSAADSARLCVRCRGGCESEGKGAGWSAAAGWLRARCACGCLRLLGLPLSTPGYVGVQRHFLGLLAGFSSEKKSHPTPAARPSGVKG